MMRPLFLLIVSSYAIVTVMTSNTASCNFNGKFQSNKCVCDAAWEGDACDILSLQATDANLGYHGQVKRSNLTSWGGSVIQDDSGVSHMYASEITNHCGMNVWLSNSQVIHATSKDPLTEPFVKVTHECLFRAFRVLGHTLHSLIEFSYSPPRSPWWRQSSHTNPSRLGLHLGSLSYGIPPSLPLFLFL